MKEWLALDDLDQDDQAKAEHLARYEWMKDLVAGRGVLDIGCGAGYGAEEMATVASYVIGVDRRPEAIAYAKSHHAAPNVFFLAAPFQELRIDDVDAFPLDVVTAFEVLEHLENPSELPAAANRFLTEDGTLVLSTPYYTRTVRRPPERQVRPRGTNCPLCGVEIGEPPGCQEMFGNPYHLWAWDARGLEELLRPHFADVRIGVQHRLEFLLDDAGPGTSWFVRCTEPSW